MADFTYHDYLLHKVVQPYSIRGQNSESSNLKKNIPLYLTRQAGKVREKFNMDSKGIVTKQAVQPPQVFLDSQFEKLQQQQEGLYIRKPGIDTNIGMNRTVKTIFQDDDLNGKDDPIIRNIKNRISNEKYVDDFFVLTEGARPRNAKKEEKLTVEKEIKTVLQEKVNEDQLKKLYRKYVLETMKKNISLEKKLQIFEKEHDVKLGSLQQIEKRKSSLNAVPDVQNYGKSVSMAVLNVAHSLVLQNSFEKESKNKNFKSITEGSKPFGLETISQLKDLEQDKTGQNENKLQMQKQLILKNRLSTLNLDLQSKQLSKEVSVSPQEEHISPISALQTPITGNQQKLVQDKLKEEEEDEDTYEQYQMKQLQKLQDINKKQQSYKFNNKESEKSHIKNICNHFDLSIQKLLNLQDKKQLQTNEMKNLTEISLDSENQSEIEDHFDDIEDIQDDSVIVEKNNNSKDKSHLQSQEKERSLLKLNQEVIQCKLREEDVLYDRIKYENEQSIVNEQDEKLIKSIINLENKQQIFQKYVQKKKRELQLQNLLNMKELSMKKQFQNSIFSNQTPQKQPMQSTQIQKTKESERKNAQSIQSFSNLKSQYELSCMDDFVKTNSQFGLNKQISYKLQNGKPVHENSVLSFLKSDYKLLDTPSPKFVQRPYNRATKLSLQNPKIQMETIQSGNNISAKKLNLARLTQLSVPKYANEEYMNLMKEGSDQISTQGTSGRKHFFTTSYSSLKKNNNRTNSKSQQQDFYTTKKENKAEVDKMKLDFLKFFDNCFEKKHEFEEEKQKLRLEISEWYCQNQQELTKLSTYSGPKLSTLSQEFKQFIEQKNFKKKLFNYLINTMQQKDRQMAIYLYKQDRQLDDL